MTRFHEDPATRRVVDTDSPAYQSGVQAARHLIDSPAEFHRVPVYQLDAEVMMSDMVAEDPDVREHWGIYLVLKGMVDTFAEYRQDRST